MASFALVSATGMLGSGFRAESLDKAISLGARMIGCDAGSTDPGPGPLATGICMFSGAAVKRDTEIMMTRAVKAGIPLIIGSSGDAELPGGEHASMASNQTAILAHQRRARPTPLLDARRDRGDLGIRVGPCIFGIRDQPIDRPPLDLVRRPRR